jgi:hypothetical protein
MSSDALVLNYFDNTALETLNKAMVKVPFTAMPVGFPENFDKYELKSGIQYHEVLWLQSGGVFLTYLLCGCRRRSMRSPLGWFLAAWQTFPLESPALVSKKVMLSFVF